MLGVDFQLPLDGSGFSLRACPRCSAEFKVRWSRREAQVLAGALAARVEHLNRAEAAAEGTARHCPYCAAIAPADAWWTPEERRWLEFEAESLVREMRLRRMHAPLDPRPGSAYAADVDDASVEVVAPPDEATDELVNIPLPCCGEEMLVVSGWIGPIRCHYCGFVHARSAVRDAWLELAQLRDWMEPR